MFNIYKCRELNRQFLLRSPLFHLRRFLFKIIKSTKIRRSLLETGQIERSSFESTLLNAVCAPKTVHLLMIEISLHLYE